MTTVLLRVGLGGFEPADDPARAARQKMERGSVVVADLTMRDNGTDQQRKFAFALLGILYEAQEAFDDAEMFRHYMTIRCGLADVKRSPDGPNAIPYSWRRGGMKKDQWIDLITRLIDMGENVFGIGRDELTHETERRSQNKMHSVVH